MLFSCKNKQPETPPATTAQQIDCTIVPGERAGLITKNACSREEVLKAYGDSAVVDTIHLVESMEGEGVVLFPNNPRRTAYIYWDPEFMPNRPSFIRILGGDMPSTGADWKTDSGLAIGATLEAVEKVNGKPFDIYGFGWDYGGQVTDWKGGKLDGTGLGFFFTLGETDAPDSLMGERVISSNNPLLAKAQPRIATIELRFPVREELPACLAEKVKAANASQQFLLVQKMTVNGADHYWFNDGAAAYDGIEYVYDANCNEVCKFGGFRKPLDCQKAYGEGKWTVVWQR